MPTQFITNPRRKNPPSFGDVTVIRVPASVHREWEFCEVDTYEPDDDLPADDAYRQERGGFVDAWRSARKAGNVYVYTLSAPAFAYLKSRNGPISNTLDIAEDSGNRRLVTSLEKLGREVAAMKTRANPRRPTKASSALTDTEKRDLRAAIVWAMDVEADGGEVPADIDRLFHADKWGNLTVAQARKVLRWFHATAPGNFVGNPRTAASVSLYVVDTSPSGKVVTIRDATRDEIRLGDAMPHDQAVYWAGVFASETTGAKIRDASNRAKNRER
jgi:hypothetical protein